jgi:dienelactone hydrolase
LRDRAAATIGGMGDLPAVGPRESPPLAVNPRQFLVLDHDLSLLRELRRERRARLAAVRTRRQALAYQERVASTIARVHGPWPERTPLEARVTGTVGREAFRIDKVVFASRPGCLVTANLYLPRGCDASHPRPAVLSDCGHSLAGKSASVYQEFPQRLAAAGLVVLVMDPFAQGERDQYARLPPELRAGLSDRSTNSHNLIGQQLELIGDYFGSWRAWDGIRALDYLLTRPEVEPARVGVSGCSGGGTMTMTLWALEPRLRYAAPSCSVTTFLANLENQLPTDSEQCPPGLLAAGLDMADFFIARAPEPSLLLGQRHDYFDRRGLIEAHREIRRFHDLLGAPRRSHGLAFDGHGHAFSRGHIEAIAEFVHRQALGKPPPAAFRSHEFVELPPEQLNATASGNVVLDGGRPAFELIAERARRLDEERRPRSAAALDRLVRRTLAIDAVAGTARGARRPPHFRVLRSLGDTARYAIESEGDTAFATLRKPRCAHPDSLDVEPHVTLWLPHLATELEPADPARHGHAPLYLLDARGLGESRPPGNLFDAYGYEYQAHAHGIMLDRPLLGRRVLDVLRAIDLLVAEGARRIDLAGRGQGAILALHAGFLARARVGGVELRNAPRSYLEWATSPVVRWPAANAPRGVLMRYDLPDLAQALGSRASYIDPWNALMEPSEKATALRSR